MLHPEGTQQLRSLLGVLNERSFAEFILERSEGPAGSAQDDKIHLARMIAPVRAHVGNVLRSQCRIKEERGTDRDGSHVYVVVVEYGIGMHSAWPPILHPDTRHRRA
jgi:hypothetical protein